jgi:hypothetical protein
MSPLVAVDEQRGAVRPGLSRAVAGLAAALCAITVLCYAIVVGPDLVDSWRSSDPDAGLVRFITTCALLLALGFAAAMLVAARLLRPGHPGGRPAQVSGAVLLVGMSVPLVFTGYMFRNGVAHAGDPLGTLAMVIGLAMLVSGISIAWPARA